MPPFAPDILDSNQNKPLVFLRVLRGEFDKSARKSLFLAVPYFGCSGGSVNRRLRFMEAQLQFLSLKKRGFIKLGHYLIFHHEGHEEHKVF